MPAEESDMFELRADDERFPALLKEIPNAPRRLFCRGDASLLDAFSIAIVGTRRASSYGKDTAASIARGLNAAGVVVVSGLAKGVDAAAHRATLEAGGKTIAVVGTGLDEKSLYPQEHVSLARDIVAKGGLLVSEYEEGTPALPHHFPQRNRIISGLSRGVVVVEAPEKSGALVTAQCALEQNREVFAIPGPVHYISCLGANRLIQQGAKLVMDANDVLSEFARFSLKTLSQETPLPLHALSKEESLILSVLRDSPQDATSLHKRTKLPTSVLSSTLSMLELKGLVKNADGAYEIMSM